jgi:hypothetical protein
MAIQKEGMSPIHGLLAKKDPYKKKASSKQSSEEASEKSTED